MKKLFLSLVILLISTGLVSANIMVRANFGYGFNLGGHKSGTDYEEDAGNKEIKNENMYYNGGEGCNLGLGVGFGLSDNLGLDVGFGYVIGSETEISKKYEPGKKDEVKKAKINYIPVDLTLKLSTKIWGLTGYLGFGPTLALGATEIQTISDSINKTEQEWETTMNAGLGFNASLGVDYEISDMFSIGLGFIIRQVSLKLDKSTVTKSTTDGVDDDLTTRGKETVYKEDDSDDDKTDQDSPEIKNAEVRNMDTFTINLSFGIKF